MVELKTAAEIDAMAAAGAVVSKALQAIVEHAKPGQPTAELNQVAADVLTRHGARSPFLNYHPRWAPTPFPAVLCVSVNDAVVHGIPNGEVLTDGDLVSVDFGAILKGWCGDAARSFIVGTPRAQDTALIEATDEALAAGIAAVRPGNTLGDVRSPRLPGVPGTACWPTTAATASAAPCTRIRTCPTKADRARACGCGQALSSRSSRC